jgi:hypothetical protein
MNTSTRILLKRKDPKWTLTPRYQAAVRSKISKSILNLSLNQSILEFKYDESGSIDQEACYGLDGKRI